MPTRYQRAIQSGPRPDWVRDVRKRLKLNQTEFADYLGVTPSTIHRWETGRVWPFGEVYHRLLGAARTAGCPPPPERWEQQDYERQRRTT